MLQSRKGRGIIATVLMVALALATLVVLAQDEPRLAASNSQVLVSGAVVTVAAGVSHCQTAQFVPEESARLRVFVGTLDDAPGEPLALSIADADGTVVAEQRVAGGYAPGALTVPFPPPERDLTAGTVCVRNLGDRPISFAGHITPASTDALQQQGPDGPLANSEEEVRVDFLRSGRESLWSLAPEVARRFSLFKPSVAGPHILWVVLALAIAVGSAAVLILVTQPVDEHGDEPREDA